MQVYLSFSILVVGVTEVLWYPEAEEQSRNNYRILDTVNVKVSLASINSLC